MLTRVLHGLHDRAVYRIKTGAGLGRTYTNSRGFREGCPNSPACFNLYHTFPMQQFAKERRRQQGTAALRGGVNYNTRFDKVRRPRNVTEENINFELDDVLFADDTTIFTTVEQHLTDEQHLRQVLGIWGEDLHAGKTERLPLGLSLEEAARQAGVDPETLKDEARFLGAWITSEASQSVDTEKRLQRGKQLWTKLWKQAYRLTLPPKIMGMLFESTVMATMLYSAEARAFTKPEIRRMQTFVNRCTLGMLNVKQRHMHDDKVTMVDLRRKLGIPSIAVAIGIRQLRWLGHVARLDDTRLEKQALWLWHEHHGPGRRSRRKRCRGTNDTSTGLWSLLQDFKTTLDIPSTTWDTDWVRRAQTEDGKLWRSDIRKWQQRKEAAEDNDLWRVRHAPGGKAETQAQQRARRKAELANLTQQGDDLFLCPHCNDPFAANRIWMHARSCALLTPAQQLNAREARLQRQRRLQAIHAPLRDPVQAPHAAAAQPPGAPGLVFRRIRGKTPPPPGAPLAPPPEPAPAQAKNAPRRPRRQVGEAREAPQSRSKRRNGISDLPAWWERDPELPPRMCQWCSTIVPKGAVTNHEKLCKDMPYNVWLRGIRMVREGLQSEVKCNQCGTPFLEARGCARHAHECRKRRIKEGLPVDTGQFHVLPPLAQGQVRRGVHAASARVQELAQAAATCRDKFRTILAQNPNHEVSQDVIQASCYDSATGQLCSLCRKCPSCRQQKCWGLCGRCKKCASCSRALLADSLTYM